MAILAAARAEEPELGYADRLRRRRDALDAARDRGSAASRSSATPAASIREACAAGARGAGRRSGHRAESRRRRGRRRRPLIVDAAPRRHARNVRRRRLPADVLSANAYLGAVPIARRCRGADIVDHRPLRRQRRHARRLIHEFGWTPTTTTSSPAAASPATSSNAAPGDRRQLHRLGAGAGLGEHRLPDRRVPRRRQIRAHQAGRHRRPGRAAARSPSRCCTRSAIPAPTCCPTSSAISAGEHRAGRRRPGPRAGARGNPPTAHIQGLGDSWMAWRAGSARHRRHRRGDEGRAHRRGDHRAGAPAAARGKLGEFTATHVEVSARKARTGRNRGRARPRGDAAGRRGSRRRRALEMFARELAPAGTSWSPGTTGPGGGRPAVSPLIKPFSFLLDKRAGAGRSFSIGGRGKKKSPFPASAERVPASGADADRRQAARGHRPRGASSRVAADSSRVGAQRRQGQPGPTSA